MSRLERWISIGLGLIVLVVYVVGITLMFVRDHQAEAKCHQLGGQTWDSGSHCTLGGRTVTTR